MKLTGARLQNIACFEDLSLDFTDPATGKPCPWIVLLGENGTGKSTVLQMMATLLVGAIGVAAVAGDINFASYIRNEIDNSPTTATLTVLTEVGDDKPYDDWDDTDPISLSARFGMDGNGKPAGYNGIGSFGLSVVPLLPFFPREMFGWFSCGYSPVRRSLGRSSEASGSWRIDEREPPYRFASIFGQDWAMTPVADWLADLYFRAIYPGHTKNDEQRFEQAKAVVLRALPHVSNLEITQDRRVIVNEGDTQVPLDRLSDGYRGTLGWIGDLIRRLFDAYPDSDDPLKESGVVLVDEIDLHLHPRWQRKIVEDVRRLFPNLQFIVTSHSPFVAQDLRPEDKIIVLERTGKGGRGPVVAREEPGTVHDWSADQILSAYFGMEEGTRGEQALRAERQYQKLLDAEAAGTLTESQRAQMERLRDRLEEIPLGDTPAARSFYEESDAVVMRLRERRERIEAARRGAYPAGEKPSGHGHNGNNGSPQG